MSGIDANLDMYPETVLNRSPSFTIGTVGNGLCGLTIKEPDLSVYMLLCNTNKSEVLLTGKNLFLGTLTP